MIALTLALAALSLSARADGVAGPIDFSIPTLDGKARLTGDLTLPGGAACAKPTPAARAPTEKNDRLPAVLLVPGSGEFDRDEDFGVSGTEKDLLFRQISWELLSRGMAVVRFDYRGVHCNKLSLPDGAKTAREEFLKRCADPEVRRTASVEAMRSDLKQVFDYARGRECLDPARILVLAHSEGTFHLAHLLREHAIDPSAIVLLGAVAESPKSLVHWQAVDREVARVMRGASEPDRVTNAELKAAGAREDELSPKGYLTRPELRALFEASYERSRAKAMAEPDTGLHDGFWPMSWWKMWWSDEERAIDGLTAFTGPIVAHGGAEDTQVPQARQADLFQAEARRFRVQPKFLIHPGLGHSLGTHTLKGPLTPEALSRLADDTAKLAGVQSGEIPPQLTSEDLAARPYFGVNFVVSEPLPESARYKSGFGLRVTGVAPGLPAWDAGIRTGDILIALNGEEIGSVAKESALAHTIRRIQALKPGEQARVLYLRWKPVAEAACDSKTPEKREFEVSETRVDVRLPRRFTPHHNEEKPPIELLAESLAARYRIERGYADVQKRLADMTARPDPFRLGEVDAIQHHPFLLGREARQIAHESAPSSAAERFPAYRALAGALALQTTGAEPLARPEPLRTGLSPKEHLAQIRALLEDADALWKKAYEALKPDEIEFLRAHLPELARKFEEWNYVYADKDTHRLETNTQVISLLSRIRLEPLLRAASSLARLADPEFVHGLKRDLARAGLDLKAAVVLSEKTPFGLILIGGTGDNDYTDLDSRGVAVLIDLGGNDRYANHAGAASPAVHASVVVDLEGDDLYESAADCAQGCGLLGIGILADLGGNDTYTGVRLSQGVGLGGVGVLIDRGGSDTYRAHSMSQGFGFFGTGLLIDLAGNDRYDARLLAQGVGVGGGFGALIDLSGNDTYFAKGYTPSGYGTPGTFEGWSQGAGVGLRFLASGGIGLLYDGGGNNVFDAGDFSQGGGYYYGLGILDAAGKGNDVYHGNRYSQGFAAHSALGALIDEGGDDSYDSRGAVSTGNANDLSVAWFEDDGGNDRYPAHHFSLGAAANNSISVFLDHGGKDRFSGTDLPAPVEANDYHGGQSFSLFVALGDGPRSWEHAPRAPIDARDGYSFVLQGGKSLDSWIKRRAKDWPDLSR